MVYKPLRDSGSGFGGGGVTGSRGAELRLANSGCWRERQ